MNQTNQSLPPLDKQETTDLIIPTDSISETQGDEQTKKDSKRKKRNKKERLRDKKVYLITILIFFKFFDLFFVVVVHLI